MKNIVKTINDKLMEVVNNIAENVAENSVASCGAFGMYEIEIPLEIINQDE